MHLMVANAPNPLMRKRGGCDLSRGYRYVWVSALTKFAKKGLLRCDTKKKQRSLLRQLDPVIGPLKWNIGLP